VLVPLRSRRVTAIVLEVGDHLDGGGATPRAVLELLDARPLFDRPHLELINFMATYYMASLAEAYRSVMPATTRVESQRRFHAAAEPSPLAAVALTALERAILAALAKGGMTARQLGRLGEAQPVETALNRLLADGFTELREGARGRHRATQAQLVRLLRQRSELNLRGVKQRAIVERLTAAGAAGLPLEQLASAVANARPVLNGLVARGIVELATDEAPHLRDGARSATPAPYEATWEQAAVIAEITPAIRERRFETFLLWGITGSGKTEVYVRLAAEALTAGRQVIVLVPEIALADQVVQAFRERFGALAAVLHSAQYVAERWAGWMAALSGATRVIIGPRSAIFAPLHDAGLIVVDEEHDPAYKQKEGIRYHARDLAVTLGRLSGCPVVLGSATPSTESYAADSTRRRARAARRRAPRLATASARTRCPRWSGSRAQHRGHTSPALSRPDRRAARQPRRGWTERHLSEPARLSQFFAMPYVRQCDRVRQLQRQHDVPFARSRCPMPLLRRARTRA
jgi:primosomal protein N' (replication factor Y)